MRNNSQKNTNLIRNIDKSYTINTPSNDANANKQLTATPNTPIARISQNCAKADHDKKMIKHHHRHQQQQPSIRTTERTPAPQQHHEATHQATHPATENYTTNMENKQPTIHTATTLPITEHNNQIGQQ